MSIWRKHRGNIVDPDQTAPTGAVWHESTLFVYEASNISLYDK